MRKITLLLVLSAALLLAGCTGTTDTPTNTSVGQVEDNISSGQTPQWMKTQLTDVRTNETFTVDGFDRPVLLESFAVWCPTCTSQQKEIQKLHSDLPVVS